MQIKILRIEDGPARVEVIDPSDGAVTHTADVNVGEQIVVTATSADSPADIEFGEVEATPEPETEATEAGSAPEDSLEQPSGVAEGAEAPADGQGTPAEGDEQAA